MNAEVGVHLCVLTSRIYITTRSNVIIIIMLIKFWERSDNQWPDNGGTTYYVATYLYYAFSAYKLVLLIWLCDNSIRVSRSFYGSVISCCYSFFNQTDPVPFTLVLCSMPFPAVIQIVEVTFLLEYYA